MSGRIPKPTKIMKLSDSRTLYDRKDEPEPDMAEPICPDWIDDETREAWLRVAARLRHMGLLSATDTDAMTRYCVMLVRWKRLEEFVAVHGETYSAYDTDGKMVNCTLYPQSREVGRLADRLLRMEQNFGLTPSSRARLAYENGRKNRPPATGDKSRFFKAG